MVEGSTLRITALKSGKVVLTVSDAIGNQFEITVVVTSNMEALMPVLNLLLE